MKKKTMPHGSSGLRQLLSLGLISFFLVAQPAELPSYASASDLSAFSIEGIDELVDNDTRENNVTTFQPLKTGIVGQSAIKSSIAQDEIFQSGSFRTFDGNRYEVSLSLTAQDQDSVKRVSVCVFNSQDEDFIQDGTFDYLDSEGTTDIERNCGGSDDDPHYMPDSIYPRHTALFTLDIDGFNQIWKSFGGSSGHKLVGVSSNINENNPTIEVSFTFTLSHALAAAENGYLVRAAAVTESEGEQPQLHQTFANQSSFTTGGITTDESDQWQQYKVNYFGGLTTERTGINFSGLSTNDLKIVEGVTLGEYVANAESKLWAKAGPFKTSDNQFQIRSATDRADLEANGGTLRQCQLASSFDADAESFLFSDDAFVLRETLYPPAGKADDDQRANPELGESLGEHSCQLFYGGGAPELSRVYSSTVTLALQKK